jgi:hypothetical protein
MLHIFTHTFHNFLFFFREILLTAFHKLFHNFKLLVVVVSASLLSSKFTSDISSGSIPLLFEF